MRGVHRRHFEGHMLVHIHSNLIRGVGGGWGYAGVSANDILKKTEEDILTKGF